MRSSTKSFELVEETPVYHGFFKLIGMRFRHTLFRGGWSGVVSRELFHRGSCVAVVPYDPVNDSVVLIEQFRVGAMKANADPWLLEIVAGAIEEGEHADEVARRESREEAGCELQELIRICEFFTSPGGSSEKITLYCGIVDTANLGGVHGLEEEDEDILVSVVSFNEAWASLESGRIESAIPIIGLQWLAMNRQRLRRECLSDMPNSG
ncbi:MAG TPA: NUDIX domain-containing protein [Methylococcaceae bacterium]|jgi:ADP-ribose pyrophosphatase|nr:NUDIX domain-containing protein [Methylococcaceae bacterium]